MLKRALMMSAFAAALALTSGFALTQESTQAEKQIYGRQLMTKQERIEHRSKIRAAKTAEEREQIRKEHHERMQERAKERGVTLPDKPHAGGCGAEPSCGMGAGRNR